MYTCRTSFTASNGKKYSSGQQINSSEYNRLFYSDKRNFSEDNDSSSDMAMNIAMGDMLGTGIPGGLDVDFSTPL